jgi:hypothetical protein
MDVGMMWFDEERGTELRARIDRAARYYKDKYGRTPNLCYIHPRTAEGEVRAKAEIEVRTSQSVQPDYFWLGLKETS